MHLKGSALDKTHDEFTYNIWDQSFEQFICKYADTDQRNKSFSVKPETKFISIRWKAWEFVETDWPIRCWEMIM